ncbi:unnamed protein product [Chondrus crispus]|uniref:Uncharacterized protein n=1 Tax=Chondrus crispus TaxID=2769 RepID=R7QS46_CHOCR|nr:unnamed protein product [Chondrus crispus]CDF40538.1 unnamed protein product [Chondrus crispus]|eukprot:XP_005710832.1 unnamed protein product [Chondrus crispus]
MSTPVQHSTLGTVRHSRYRYPWVQCYQMAQKPSRAEGHSDHFFWRYGQRDSYPSSSNSYPALRWKLVPMSSLLKRGIRLSPVHCAHLRPSSGNSFLSCSNFFAVCSPLERTFSSPVR